MRTLVLLGSSGAAEQLGDPDTDLLLGFDPLELSESVRGQRVVMADELLGWDQRAVIESDVRQLLAGLRADAAAAALRVCGNSLLDASEWHLRSEFTNVLCAYTAVAELVDGDAIESVVSGPRTPTSVRLGAEAAVADALRRPPQLGVDEWTPIYPVPQPSRSKALAGAVLLRARAGVGRERHARVVALPTMKLAAALAQVSSNELRAAGVALTPFPGTGVRRVLEIARERRLPFVAPAIRIGSPMPPALAPGALLALDQGDQRASLTEALCVIARKTFVDTAYLAGQTAATIKALEDLRDLRSLVLPTAAVGQSLMLQAWAARRGITCAVVQHGSYFFRDWDGGDSRADVLFGWGEGVREQMDLWDGPTPRLVAAGAPTIGVANAKPSTGPVERLLVATTGNPKGSAFGLYGFADAFLRAIAPGVRLLHAHGVLVELRLHPVEQRSGYERRLKELGLPVRFSEAPDLASAVDMADAVIASFSSSAFEAAGRGRPVALWTGQIPGDILAAHFVPPLCDPMPATFSSSDDFQRLAEMMIHGAAAFLEESGELGAILAAYARPFDAALFAAEVERLGTKESAVQCVVP